MPRVPDWDSCTASHCWPAGTMEFIVYGHGNKRPKKYVSRDDEIPSNFLLRVLQEEHAARPARISGLSVAISLAKELKTWCEKVLNRGNTQDPAPYTSPTAGG